MLKGLGFILMQNREIFVGWEKCVLPSCGPCHSAGRPAAVSLGCSDGAWTDRGTQGVFMSSSLSQNSPLWYHSQMLLFPLRKGQAVQHDLEGNKKHEMKLGRI